jgi:hypothetical protein
MMIGFKIMRGSSNWIVFLYERASRYVRRSGDGRLTMEYDGSVSSSLGLAASGFDPLFL